MKKVLCLCLGGNSRSVTLAYMLKVKYGMDAIAAGVGYNSAKTLRMLADWADKIILLDVTLKSDLEFLGDLGEKLIVYDVGPDLWFDPNYELMNKLQSFINRDKVAGMID